MEKLKAVFNKIKSDFSKLSLTIKNFNKTYKIIFLVVLAVVVVDVGLMSYLVSNRKKSKLNFTAVGYETKMSLISLDSGGHNSRVKGKNGGFATFKFSSAQKAIIKQFYEKNNTAAVAIRVEVIPDNKQLLKVGNGLSLNFKMGYLQKKDFSKKGKFIPLKSYSLDKVVVSADYNKIFRNNLENNPGEKQSFCFDLSYAIPRKAFEQLAEREKKTQNQNSLMEDDFELLFPEGFFVYSDFNLKIKSFCIAPVEIGYDKSEEIPFFGFSANGGVLDLSNSSVDYSGASSVFAIHNVSRDLMPEILVKFNDNPEFKSVVDKAIISKLNVGGEQLFVKNVSNAKEIIIPAAALKNPFILIDLAENKQCIDGMILRSHSNNHQIIYENTDKEVYNPIRTDPGLIVQYSKKNWRVCDYEVFEWDRFPGILFFDTADYDIQGKFFSRLAYFVEKAGFKGKILTNAQLNGKHGYNAHDYSAESLADFFNAADKTGVELNKEEEILRKILVQNGLLIKSENGNYEAGKGGLVSISQQSEIYLRTQLLAHEGWHTLFFMDEDFRNFVAAVYYTLDEKSQQFLIDYFQSQTSLGYDINDEYLMKNEFMAYIMQNALGNVVNYFVSHAKWSSVKKYTPELADYIVKTNARGFEDAAIMLNDFVFDKYGIICGNISLVRR